MDGTPFDYQGPARPELLIDRDDELRVLARRAADRIAVRLVAPRRYGKTSILLAHARTLEASSWQVAYVDCSRVAAVGDVARRIAVAYAPLDMPWLRAHLGGLLARLGITLTGPAPSVSLTMMPRRDPAAAEEAIYRLLDLPHSVHARTQQPTLVIFDEFQDLLTARDDLDGLLRSRIQYHGDSAAYVYAGSEPSLMRALFEERERPLYGQADPLTLGPLPSADLFEALAERFEAEGLDPGEALGQLVAFAEGHPQRTMMLAYHLADTLAEDDAEGTAEMAGKVIVACVAKTAAAHAALWERLERTEQIVLAALADGLAATSRAVAHEHRISHDALAQAARRLESTGQLARAGRGWQIVDPLLAEWLRRR
jgi:hypothetical protein